MPLTQDANVRDHAFGPLNADIVLVQYADFECPYSKRAHMVIKDVANWYGNLVCVIFRHFPQTKIHPRARLAAVAAEAAATQGLFWEMQDYLFSNQQLLDRQHLLRYARQLGLDIPSFTRELDNNVHVNRIDQDLANGTASGVSHTPTFFLNGRRLLDSDLEDLLDTLHSELYGKVRTKLMLVHG